MGTRGVRRLTAVLGRRRDREALAQAAKAGGAAVLALAAATAIGGGPAFLAPYAAVLAVTSTVRRSWSGAARQAAMLVVGAVLAYGVRWLVPWPAAALAAVVMIGLLLGRWRPFGGDREWIAITAVLLVINGVAAHPLDLVNWVVLSVVGSTVGAGVNTFLLPPLHLRDAHDTVRELTAELAEHLRTVAAGVREGWQAADAARWLADARGLRASVRRADDAVWFGRETLRWNLRGRYLRTPDVRLADPGAVHRVERLSERVVQIGVLLGDLADIDVQAPDPLLADALDELATAVDVTAAHAETRDEIDDALSAAAERLRGHGDPLIEPTHVRTTCFVTIQDATTDLTDQGEQQR